MVTRMERYNNSLEDVKIAKRSDKNKDLYEKLKVADMNPEYIDINTTNDKNLALEKFKFDVLFSGDDWKGTERYKKTEEDFKKRNVSIEYLPYTKDVSTTMIKEKLKNTK